MKGYLEQKGTPTPDKPVEIKSKLIGKNLFETYEVNSRTYTGNLPKNVFISIPKKQYIEYGQQKEEIERLNKELEKLKQPQVFIDTQDMEERYGEELYKEYLEKENKRLNNIINELEKTLLEWHEYWEDDDSYSWQYKNAYDYLQELKGEDKE